MSAKVSPLATDVLVVGSGVAGVCAAIQAGRLGCDVMLIEKDEVLGGNSGPNLGIHISGAHSFHPYASETGIIGELEEKAAYRCAKMDTYTLHYNISRLWESVLQDTLVEAGVRVFKRHLGKQAIVEQGKITSVIVEDIATYQTKHIEVHKFVIDASGDGHVAYTAGAKYRMGREARHEFGEEAAPETPDGETLGTSMTALVRKTDHAVEFVAPVGTPEYTGGYGYDPRTCSHSCWNPDADFCFLWSTETGGQLDTVADDHEIYEELLRQTYSVWNHIKNGPHREEALNWDLIWVSPKAGKRESRRFVGDYILKQQDVETARDFADKVGYGGYAIDLHNPVGTLAEVVFVCVPPLWNMPYRCLYSVNVDNLFLAGRLVSVSHVALGSTRLIKTLSTMGQAVGAAAHLCTKYGITPRQLGETSIEELQQLLLRQDATILGKTNGDPHDLARRASVTASSEETFECTNPEEFVSLADRSRGIILWNWPEHLEAVELYLQNELDEPVEVSCNLGLYQATHKWKESHEYDYSVSKARHIFQGAENRMEWGTDCTISKFSQVATATSTVPARFKGWVRFAYSPTIALIPKDATCDESRYSLTISPTAGIYWARSSGYRDFALRCTANPGDTEYEIYEDCHLFRITPRPLFGEAVNVINGHNRRYATNPVNMWISKRGEVLPQYIELDLGKECEFSKVHITFDTLHRAYRDMPFNCGHRVCAMCVTDYQIQVATQDGWTTKETVAGNYLRFRTHDLGTVRSQKLRIQVDKVYDPKYTARIYEVRVYP